MRTVPAFLLFLFLLCFTGTAGAGADQNINQQLQQGGIVHLPAGTYTLTDSIVMQSNSILEGEPGTVITIPDHADWNAWKPLISATGKQNVIICNIEFNGNSVNNQDVASKTKNGKAHGNGFYNFIHAIDCDNITVSNCLMHDSLGDGFRAKTSTNVKFYDNTAYKLGHDCFYGIDSQNIEAFNNRLTTRTNSALRLWNVAHARLYSNVIDAQLDGLGGNPGVQIEDSKGQMQDIEVCNNIIAKTWGSGIWLIAYESGTSNNQAVNIHHNLFWETAQSHNIGYAAGITCGGQSETIVKNNVFDGTLNTAWDGLAGGQGVIIQDNVITNTVNHAGGSQAGSGYGIANKAGSDLSIISNCFFNNLNGDLYKCTSTNDDKADPKTHNTSSGWWWTGSTWTCAFVAPMELGSITPTSTRDTTDTDVHEFNSIFDLLNMQFTDTGISSSQNGYPDIQWKENGKSKAWVDIVGWNNLTERNGTFYIPEGEPPIVRYGAENTASRPISTDTSVALTEANGTLTADLKVTAVYEVAKRTTKKVNGFSFPSIELVRRDSTSHYFDSEPMPETYKPAINTAAYVTILNKVLLQK
jgi:hypothetical protein